jgi:transcription-repair coupling factor (superfamily II helicase)
MRDLELRGAGNLLGREQSGHIAGVGFDLYCQLLRQSIARLRGDSLARAIRAEVRLDFVQYSGAAEEIIKSEKSKTPDADVDAEDILFADDAPAEAQQPVESHGFRILRNEEIDAGRCAEITATLPASYIEDTRLRIDIFRKLAMAPTVAAVRATVAEMEDRFGKMPECAVAFAALSEIRCLAESRGVVSVETEGARLKCKRAFPAKDGGVFIKTGVNFPRLEGRTPLKRIREIKAFLSRQPEVK